MTEPEKIDQIEQALAALEKEVSSLKDQLAELRQARASAPAHTVASLVQEPLQDTPGAVPDIPDTAFSINSGASPINPHTTAQVADFSAARHPDIHPDTKASDSGVKSSGQTAAKTTPSSRFEENLGGKVMGIVAAVLVFVGLFLFGSLLYEHLGDTARIALLFLVSFVLLGTGLFIEHRKRSIFTTSLTGCGFGAIYISLFITTLYYERLTTEALYVLLFFWLAGVGLYVFRRQSYIVALLGQAGITFSVIFGILNTDTTGLFNFLCVYFVLLSQLYLWVVLWRFLPAPKEKPYLWVHLTAAGLNVIQLLCLASAYDLLFGSYGRVGGRNWLAGSLLCLYCLILPVFFLLRQRLLAQIPLLPWVRHTRALTKENFTLYKAGSAAAVVYALYQVVCCTVFHKVIGGLFEAEVPFTLFLLLGILLLWLLLECFGTVGTEGQGACIVSAAAVSLLIWKLPVGLQHLLPPLFAVITAAFGILGTEYPVLYERDSVTARWSRVCRKQNGRWIEKFTSVFYLPLLLFSYDTKDGWGAFWFISLFCILFLTACFCFLYKKDRQHRFSDAWKKELYLSALLHSGWMTATLSRFAPALSQVAEMTITITVLTLINSIAFYGRFRRLLNSPEETDDWATVLVRGVHTILWIWGLALFRSVAHQQKPLLCVWLLLLTLYLCGSGMYEQYKKYRKQKWLGIYFGVRITVYCLVVLTSFSGIEGYVISCVLLLLAIIAVLTGFPLRLAPLRVYGLCLAMFAVIKLLMADLRHDNSMETVLCFLSAGILCFAINFIYNHVKKSFDRFSED